MLHVTDIPEMPRPQVTEYRVQVCQDDAMPRLDDLCVDG